MIIPKKHKLKDTVDTPLIEDKSNEEDKEEKKEEKVDKASIAKALNNQVNLEQYSTLVYEHLASWCDENDYINAAKWLYKKGMEETTHKAKFMNYINDRGWKVEIRGTSEPDIKVETLGEVLNAALSHEKKVSASISNIQDQCEEVKDRLTYNFLDWFLVEQVEEEAVLMDLLSLEKLMSDRGLLDLHFKTL
jgi:ferritin